MTSGIMKKLLIVLFACLIVVLLVIKMYLPAGLSLVLDNVFWSALLAFAASIYLIGHLCLIGSTSKNVTFWFALSLILMAAILYASLEHVAANVDKWGAYLQSDYPTLFMLLFLFVAYAKSIVVFGIAAIGANIAATVITASEKIKLR
jgi:hypothetical protein